MIELVRVVPAVLTDNPVVLKTMIQQAAAFTDYVQIDIMDGKFVPSKSVTAQDLKKLCIGIDWEAHLMVNQPERYLEAFSKAGADKVIFHFESTSTPRDVIMAARQMGLKVGLAVNPDTKVSDFVPLVFEVDSILFLTVQPGFYGAKFIPEVLEKVRELRQNYPDIEIAVDGGVNAATLEQIVRSGVNMVCIGSAIFMQPDPGEQYRKFLSVAVNALKTS